MSEYFGRLGPLSTCGRLTKSSFAGRFAVASLAIFSLPGTGFAQSQSTPPQQPQKTYTNADVAALPPGDVSVVGPPPSSKPKPQTSHPSTKPTDDATRAAYWKARFTAARQKLAQDEQALSDLQNQMQAERYGQGSEGYGARQLYSSSYNGQIRQINPMRQAVQNDKQALNNLYDEFHRAGGQPAWIQ